MPFFPDNHPSRRLFHALKSVEPYPKGVVAVPRQIEDTSFFPGGSGLWCEGAPRAPMFPARGIMVLGHDFHSLKGYIWASQNVVLNLRTPTWRHLLPVLAATEVCLGDCFFTNVFMGLREGSATTGRFPGATDEKFVERCQGFFQAQLRAQRPRLIVALGAHVPVFLSDLSTDLACWRSESSFRCRDMSGSSLVPSANFDCGITCTAVSLLHPSYRPSNVRHRRWRQHVGNAAELSLLGDALVASGLRAGTRRGLTGC